MKKRMTFTLVKVKKQSKISEKMCEEKSIQVGITLCDSLIIFNLTQVKV